jgi:hypothetical protein
LREPYSAHPAAVILLQQHIATFWRYKHSTQRVLIQDLPGLLLSSYCMEIFLRHFRPT